MQAIEHIAHSQDALQLLLPQGDFAGALDIMDDIQVWSSDITNTISPPREMSVLFISCNPKPYTFIFLLLHVLGLLNQMFTLLVYGNISSSKPRTSSEVQQEQNETSRMKSQGQMACLGQTSMRTCKTCCKTIITKGCCTALLQSLHNMWCWPKCQGVLLKSLNVSALTSFRHGCAVKPAKRGPAAPALLPSPAAAASSSRRGGPRGDGLRPAGLVALPSSAATAGPHSGGSHAAAGVWHATVSCT